MQAFPTSASPAPYILSAHCGNVLNWFGSLTTIYSNNIEPAVQKVLEWYEDLVANIDPARVPQAEAIANNILGSLASGVTSLSRSLVGYAQKLAMGTPKFFISLIFCIVSTVFLSMDYPNITYFFLAQFPEKSQKTILEAKNYLVGTIGGMFVGTIALLVVVPVLFVVFQWIEERVFSKKRK